LELNNLFLYSVSIFSILASILVVIAIVWLIYFSIRISKITKAIEHFVITLDNTVSETGESIRNTATTLEQFVKGIFAFDTIKNGLFKIFAKIKNNKGEENEE
jgi:hypothetical protein